jgi:hypothetical protein
LKIKDNLLNPFEPENLGHYLLTLQLLMAGYEFTWLELVEENQYEIIINGYFPNKNLYIENDQLVKWYETSYNLLVNTYKFSPILAINEVIQLDINCGLTLKENEKMVN